MIERRANKFVERLSILVIVIAACGGFLVLLDPKVSGQILGFQWTFGTGDFSAELKGAVVTIMLIGGWTSVVSFWVGASKTDEQKTATLSRIAEAAAPAVAAAVTPAATTENMNVHAEQVNVNGQPSPQEKP